MSDANDPNNRKTSAIEVHVNSTADHSTADGGPGECWGAAWIALPLVVVTPANSGLLSKAEGTDTLPRGLAKISLLSLPIAGA